MTIYWFTNLYVGNLGRAQLVGFSVGLSWVQPCAKSHLEAWQSLVPSTVSLKCLVVCFGCQVGLAACILLSAGKLAWAACFSSKRVSMEAESPLQP